MQRLQYQTRISDNWIPAQISIQTFHPRASIKYLHGTKKVGDKSNKGYLTRSRFLQGKLVIEVLQVAQKNMVKNLRTLWLFLLFFQKTMQLL